MDPFTALVERHGPQLYRLAYRLTGNEQDARDAVQEALLRAYRGFAAFEGRSDAGTWLYRIVVNCSMDLHRAARTGRSRHTAAPLAALQEYPSASASPERLAASAETQRRIAAALDQLTPVERAAFTLRHFEGQATGDIGRLLGIRGNAARQHVFRAMRKLRAALAFERSGQ